MKKSFIVLQFLLLVLFSCSTSVNNRDANFTKTDIVLANLDFEQSTIEPWQNQFTSSRNFSIVTDPMNSQNSVGVFSLFGNEVWISPNNGTSTARSEIQLIGSAPQGSQVVYSWDFMVDDRYEEFDDWQVVAQFHDQPDPSIGENWATYPAHSPPVSFKYRNGSLIVAVFSWESNRVIDIASLKIQKGKWYQIKSRVFWNTSKTGTLETWVNGESMVAPNGQTKYVGQNCFNSAGNYLKIGLYRSKDISGTGIVYFDNVKSSIDN